MFQETESERKIRGGEHPTTPNSIGIRVYITIIK